MKFKMKVSMLLVVVLAVVFGTTVLGADSSDITADTVKGTPVIDGVVDDIWSKTEGITLDNYVLGSKETHAQAVFKTMWDEENLYFLAIVKDKMVVNLSSDPAKLWFGDAVEIFVDELNEKYEVGWDPNDGQYVVSCDDQFCIQPKKKGGGYDSRTVVYKAIKNNEGYVVEIAFPWVELKGNVSAGTQVGLQLQVDDDSVGDGVRDGQLAWSPLSTNIASNWGTITLIDSPAPKDTTSLVKKPESNPETGDSSILTTALLGIIVSVAGIILWLKKRIVANR